MSVFSAEAFQSHENVIFGFDEASGLRAIIAIHSTLLGPAAGGVRMWPYASEEEALEDALRLSQGMTYKSALAGLPVGGGKSVIIGDAKTEKTEALLRAFGRLVEAQNGRYLTAEDVGMKVADLDIVAEETASALGTSNASGDPSEATASGVFRGIKAAVAYKLGKSDLDGVKVAVQGLGNVGWRLAVLLHKAGARLVVADLSKDKLERAAKDYGAEIFAADKVHGAPVDVFAPCALGAILNKRSIPEIQATIVAGSANNQLEDIEDGMSLRDRGILYAPDYVINSGGIIDVIANHIGETQEAIERRLTTIPDRLLAVFERADRDDRPTALIADQMAEEVLADAKENPASAA